MANARHKNVVRRASSTLKRKRKVNPCHKRPNPKQISAELKKALALSERFHQLVPRRIVDRHFEFGRSLSLLGGCSQINYISDKYDGKIREYWHRFTGKAALYAVPTVQRDGSRLLVIRGKFKITDEGIIG